MSGATSVLMNEGWPNKLLIFRNYFLQNSLYIDNIAGLQWYIVVLIPADIQPDHLGPGSNLYPLVIAIVTITLSITVICTFIIIYIWRFKIMQLTQPVFTLMILIGGIVLCVYCYLELGSNTYTLCTVRVYMFNLAFTFAFAPLIIKSYRVHFMFNLNPTAKKHIHSYVLVLYTLMFVAIDAFIMTITIFVFGNGTRPEVTMVQTSSGAYQQLTYCGYHFNNIFYYSELVLKGCMLLMACLFTFLTRNVAGAIAGTKASIIISYNSAITFIIIILIVARINDIEATIVSEVVGVCFCVLVSACVLVLPVYYQILFIGDKEALGEAVTEVLHSKNRYIVTTPVAARKSVSMQVDFFKRLS